ncbi:MAG: AMP-binding protein, partial [Alphaproteobacteria bacterium]
MAAKGEHYDDLEIRDPAQREKDMGAALSEFIAHAQAKSAYYKDVLKGVDGKKTDSREALAALPVTRKAEMAARQKSNPPLGGVNTVPLSELSHIYMSPGPIFEPDTAEPDYWRFARGLFAAGARAGDIIHNTFSYHLTPAASMVDSAAKALGCPVIPAGVGNTEIQIEAIARLRPVSYAGTPSFLAILMQKAKELGADVSSIKNAFVGAEAFPPALKKEIAEFGIFVLESYGTGELGLIAYESPSREGMIIEEKILVEIVRPGTGDPVPEGEVGEVLVTNFNMAYPLIRYATGDMSAVLPGISPCGRTNMRIRGWLGRADPSTKFKGMFVHPSAVMQIAARHPEITKARLVITSADNNDAMTLKFAAPGADASLQQAVEASIQAVLKLRGAAEQV